jgi:flagellar hook-basal body complex protein FliE
MVENISPLTPGQRPTKPQKPLPTEGERSFKNILQDSLDSVNKMQADADLTLEKLFKNEASSEEVMISFKKAQLAFEAMMQIRNKLVDAFEEIQRMRI